MGNVPPSEQLISVDLLDRYLAGTASAGEIEAVRAWISADPRRSALARWSSASDDEIAAVDAAWHRVAHGVMQSDASQTTHDVMQRTTATRSNLGGGVLRPPNIASARPSRWSAIASAVTIATAVVVVTSVARTALSHPPSPARVYVTHATERKTVALDDGTRVLLAPDSRFEMMPGFGRESRTVRLVGEAYVIVAHADGAPFIVQTGRIQTRVLGTAFGVRRYASDSAVRLAVVTGRVSVQNARGAARLAAGNVSEVTDSSTTVVSTADVHASVAWTQGRLVFTDTPVPVLLTALERWYGYHFELMDSVLTRRYVTATFDVSKPDEAMAVLRGILGVSMTIDGDRVMMRTDRDTVRLPARSRSKQSELMSSSKEIGR